MRSKEPAVHAGAASGPRGHRPGSRPARLSEAGKQLEILLEDVDIDEEPALADALADAVSAAGRATELVGDDEAAPGAGMSGRTTRDQRGEAVAGERSAARERADWNVAPSGAGRVAFARRPGDE